MLNLKSIREDAKPFLDAMNARNASTQPILDIVSLDKKWREIKQKAEKLKCERNEQSKKINDAKKSGLNVSDLILQTKDISSKIKETESLQLELESKMNQILLNIPNIAHKSVPYGKSEADNKEILKWGKIKKTSKDVLAHYEIGPKVGLDFERGVKLAGSRFCVMQNDMALLSRAISNYMLNTAIKNGYVEISPPYIVNSKTMQGSAQLPKFCDELYKLEGTDYWLIPTAEVALVNMHSDEVLDASSLPIFYTALTSCFRKEAGNYQKDIKGIIRQHQFEKVELVKLCTPHNSYDELESMRKNAQSILEGLELPYRVIELCTGDLGFASAKTYDIEVWVASQDTYREISSCSNCEDFQARRANIKFRQDGKNEFVHTLNGSALAVGRTMVAILENYQQDGQIVVPRVLRDFMQKDVIITKKV